MGRFLKLRSHWDHWDSQLSAEEIMKPQPISSSSPWVPGLGWWPFSAPAVFSGAHSTRVMPEQVANLLALQPPRCPFSSSGVHLGSLQGLLSLRPLFLVVTESENMYEEHIKRVKGSLSA